MGLPIEPSLIANASQETIWTAVADGNFDRVKVRVPIQGNLISSVFDLHHFYSNLLKRVWTGTRAMWSTVKIHWDTPCCMPPYLGTM